MTTAANKVATRDIADDINAAHPKPSVTLRAAVAHAVRAGELLLRAKQTVGHGD